MAIAVNSSFTATIPYVFGGNAPVVDLGQSPGVINTAVALTNAGSVVLSLPGAPKGAVTYTAAGLLHVLANASAITSRPTRSTEEQAPAGRANQALANDANAVTPSSSSNAAGAADGVYDGSGVFTPTSGVSANFADVLSSNPGLSSAAVSSAAAAQSAVGTLVSTSA